MLLVTATISLVTEFIRTSSGAGNRGESGGRSHRQGHRAQSSARRRLRPPARSGYGRQRGAYRQTCRSWMYRKAHPERLADTWRKMTLTIQYCNVTLSDAGIKSAELTLVLSRQGSSSRRCRANPSGCENWARADAVDILISTLLFPESIALQTCKCPAAKQLEHGLCCRSDKSRSADAESLDS